MIIKPYSKAKPRRTFKILLRIAGYVLLFCMAYYAGYKSGRAPVEPAASETVVVPL